MEKVVSTVLHDDDRAFVVSYLQSVNEAPTSCRKPFPSIKRVSAHEEGLLQDTGAMIYDASFSTEGYAKSSNWKGGWNETGMHLASARALAETARSRHRRRIQTDVGRFETRQ